MIFLVIKKPKKKKGVANKRASSGNHRHVPRMTKFDYSLSNSSADEDE